MKMKFILIFLFPAILLAQSPKQRLNELQEKYKESKSFVADFIQVTKTASEKDEFRSSGKIFFKRKNSVRIELLEQTVITDGKTIWNYNAKQKKVIITNSEAQPSLMSIDNLILELPSACTISAGERNSINLKPKGGDAEFSEINIYPDNEHLLSKIEITDVNGNYFSFEFSNIRLNVNLGDKQFTFSAPKGTRTVDLR